MIDRSINKMKYCFTTNFNGEFFV